MYAVQSRKRKVASNTINLAKNSSFSDQKILAAENESFT